jgi:4-amino-4-deoxy-L-arabinose transferase-like glycosyltransferase
MAFIGDQGWFYLSARDMLLTGQIPLVGIASGHVWLHQGPLWTYLLSIALSTSDFNPVSGAYLTALVDMTALLVLYKFSSDFFSKKIGFITALLYATSPLIVLNARFAYHTSPIPLFVILFLYSCVKWVKEAKLFYFTLSLQQFRFSEFCFLFLYTEFM